MIVGEGVKTSLADFVRYVARKVLRQVGIFEYIRLQGRIDLFIVFAKDVDKFLNVSEGYKSVYGLTYKKEGRYKVAVYVENDMSIWSYYDVAEICRRVSHEFTHVYAFENYNDKARLIHMYIDEAVETGEESKRIVYRTIELKYKEMPKPFYMSVYDLKATCEKAIGRCM